MKSPQDQFHPFAALIKNGLADEVADYAGPFAEQYDLLGGRYEGDVDFYLNEFSGGSHILEIGSGTGRLTLPLAKAGNHVTGLEPSQDMTEQLQRKLEVDKVAGINIVLGSVTNTLAGEGFDAVIAPFNMVYHLLDQNDRQIFFKQTYRQLRSGGKLYLHYFFPDEEATEGVGGKFFSAVDCGPDSNAHMICNYSSFDPQSRVNTVESVHLLLRQDKTYKAFRQVFREYHMPIPELKERALAAGFEIEGLYGDFAKTPLRDVARKEFVMAVVRKP